MRNSANIKGSFDSRRSRRIFVGFQPVGVFFVVGLKSLGICTALYFGGKFSNRSKHIFYNSFVVFSVPSNILEPCLTFIR